MDTLEETKEKNIFKRALKRAIRFFYVNLVEPKSENDDLRRKEFVLNVILLAAITLALIFTFSVIYQSSVKGDEYTGVFPELPFIVLLVFVFLLVLSRSLLFELASYLLVLICLIVSTLTAYYWGVDNPESLIAYALIIVVSGILIGSRFSFLITIFIYVVLTAIAYFQVNGMIKIGVNWKDEIFDLMDVFEYSVTFGAISIVSWLSNREIKNSLQRARFSEAALKKERDMLEDRVRARTKELQKMQYEKARQLCRLAEFGRLSSGLFHDLSNYINALLLNIRKIDPKGSGVFRGANEDIERVDVTMEKVSDFVSAINKQLSWQDSSEVFSVSGEIKTAIQVVSYRAIKNDVEIFTDFDNEEIFIYGNSVKFNQVIINLLVNAIDAYGVVSRRDQRRIEIVTIKKNNSIYISIEDWACGIPKSIAKNIFDPFFTTKKTEGGVGIGLSNVKEIVEKSFNGSIIFETQKGNGTKFIIEIPDDDNDFRKG